MQTTRSFIGMNTHKATISISVAEDGRVRRGQVYRGDPERTRRHSQDGQAASKHGELDFCYEAGGCGYNIYRQLTALGHRCTVAATSLMLVVWGTGTPRRELLHADDLARGCLFLMTLPDVEFDKLLSEEVAPLVNIGTGEGGRDRGADVVPLTQEVRRAAGGPSETAEGVGTGELEASQQSPSTGRGR